MTYAEWSRNFKTSCSWRCELCGTDRPPHPPENRQKFEVHHIGGGESKCTTRQERCAALTLCWECHNAMDERVSCPSCCDDEGNVVGVHGDLCRLCDNAREVKAWSVEHQLAILLIRRKDDLDLDVYNSLVTGKRTRTREEVDAALKVVRERILTGGW